MTPLVFLVGFCLLIAAVAVGRVVGETPTNRSDIGSAVIILGITVLAAFWVMLEEPVLGSSTRVVIGILGVVLVVVGIALVIRGWDEPMQT